MSTSPAPRAHQQTLQQTIGISGPPLTPVQTVLAVVCLVLVLWLAYRIGIVILRLVAGFLFLGLVAYGFWYLFVK
jgi:hypothetical protein